MAATNVKKNIATILAGFTVILVVVIFSTHRSALTLANSRDAILFEGQSEGQSEGHSEGESDGAYEGARDDHSVLPFTIGQPNTSHLTVAEVSEKVTVNPNQVPLVYEVPSKPSLKGKPFTTVSTDFVAAILPQPIELTPSGLQQFVFATAMSQDYVYRALYLINTLQLYYPNHRLILYDLGLEEPSRVGLASICQVEVRKFDFSKYPPHVKELHSYAFKPLVVNEILREGVYNGVFWADGSIRFKSSNMTLLFNKALESDGMAVFTGTDHSLFSVTVEQMFAYLPLVKDPKIVECLIATTVLMYRTKNVVDNILRWWVTCALSEECIWNRPYSGCPFARNGANRWTEFGFCSRYDQSALSILLYNNYPNIDVVLAYRIWGPGIDSEFLRINRTDSTWDYRKCV